MLATTRAVSFSRFQSNCEGEGRVDETRIHQLEGHDQLLRVPLHPGTVLRIWPWDTSLPGRTPAAKLTQSPRRDAQSLLKVVNPCKNFRSRQ